MAGVAGEEAAHEWRRDGLPRLQVTVELADSTLPYLAGPRTIEEFIAPAIARVVAKVGRPDPRSIALLLAAVAEDVAAVRAALARQPPSPYEIPPSKRSWHAKAYPGLRSPLQYAAQRR